MSVKKKGLFLSILVCVCAFNQVSGGMIKSSSPPVKELPKPLPKEQPAPLLLPLPTVLTQQEVYTHPGIVVLKDGVWEGNDYLYNLTNQIGISVEINKPAAVTIDLSETNLKSIVEASFRKGSISPIARSIEDEPSLPFFHIQILIYPIENGYAVVCEARLFEAVSTKRAILERGSALQVITWEKQTLMVLPIDKAVSQVEKTVGNMSDGFVQLFQFYEAMKNVKK